MYTLVLLGLAAIVAKLWHDVDVLRRQLHQLQMNGRTDTTGIINCLNSCLET